MAYDYIIKKNKALTLKVEATPGTFNQPTSATDFLAIEDVTVDDGLQVQPSNENTGNPDQGETDVTHSEPTIQGTFKLRGSGDVTVPPHGMAALQACGIGATTQAVLPAATTSTPTAAGGTTSSFNIDRTVGNGTEWPSTPAGCALLVGAPVQFGGAQSGTYPIEACTIAGTLITVVVCHIFGAALDNTSTVKVLPGQRLDPTDDLGGAAKVSIEVFEDGTLKQFKGGAGVLDFSIDGAARGILNLTLKAALHATSDAAVPSDINASTLQNAPYWKKGLARLAKLKLACTSFALNLGIADTRHRAPEEADGIDVTQLVGRQVTGKLVVNKVKKATQDRLGIALANTKMAMVLVIGDVLNGAAGTRFVIIVPKFKFTKTGNSDFNGVTDDSSDYQAVRVPPYPTFRLYMF